MKHNKGRFEKEHEAILHALDTVVDSIADAFGSNCEVVLHDLRDLAHSVVKIANGHITGRKIGSPMTDFGAEILKEASSSGKDVVVSYHNQLEDGRLLKSTTSVVRDAQGKPIGMICINIDLSVSLLDFIREFIPQESESSVKVVEHFPTTIDELVSRTFEMVMIRVNSQTEFSPSDKNKAIVMELYKKRMFDVRGTVDIVAKKIGISRYTVYNYIREAKSEVGEKGNGREMQA
jgi:predicted transcriptional regulator YheO